MSGARSRSRATHATIRCSATAGPRAPRRKRAT